MTQGPTAPLVAALARLGTATQPTTTEGTAADVPTRVQECLDDIVLLLSRPRYSDSKDLHRHIVRQPLWHKYEDGPAAQHPPVDTTHDQVAVPGTVQAWWHGRSTCDECRGHATGTAVTVPPCRVLGCADAALLRDAAAVCQDTNAEAWTDLLASLSSFIMPVCTLRAGMSTLRVRTLFRIVAVDPVYTFAPKGDRRAAGTRRPRRAQVHGSVVAVDVRQPWFAISVVVSGRSLHLFWSWLSRIGATFAAANFSVGIASDARAARSGHPYHVRLNPDSMLALVAEPGSVTQHAPWDTTQRVVLPGAVMPEVPSTDRCEAAESDSDDGGDDSESSSDSDGEHAAPPTDDGSDGPPQPDERTDEPLLDLARRITASRTW